MKLLSSISVFLTLICATYAQDRLTGETFTTRSEILAQNGMASMALPPFLRISKATWVAKG